MRINKNIDIQHMTDAKNIVKIAKMSGLYDVDSWVTPPKAQILIDNDFWIVFIANISQVDKNLTQEIETNDVNKAIGLIAGGLEEEGRIWIELMGVSSAFRRIKVGTQLVHRLESYARKKGFRALFVDVDTDNFNALRFYKKIGFKRAGKVKKYYYDSSATIIYVKLIK